jgi:signal transduction histidine kinase
MFLDVVNSLPDAVLLVTDADGEDRVEWANDAAGRLLGVQAEALVGVALSELMPAADLERLRSRLAQRNTEPFRCDVMRRTDHENVGIEARVMMRRDRFSGMYLISAREVRQAARLEELLGELGAAVLGSEPSSLADSRALVRALDPIFRARHWSGALWEAREDSAVLRHVISGWGMGRDAWQSAQRLVGQPVPYSQVPLLAEVKSRGRGIFVDEVAPPSAGRDSERPPGDDEGIESSLRARRMARGAWAPISTRRGVTHVLTVVGAGMTESDFAAVLLIANQLGSWMTMSELGAKNAHDEHHAALAEMASVVAHELRAPALIMDSTARRLEQAVAGDSRLEPGVALLRKQIGALDGLVERLLTHGKTLGALRQPAPVSRAIERALAEIELPEGMRPIDVELPVPAPIVRADPLLLAHAIAELVENALSYVPAGGRVRIAVETHHTPDGEEARIAVSHDGEPAPPEVASRMFDPYFSTTGRAGLGLSVARRVVAALHGRLEHDRDTNGASMSLWLPIELRLLTRRAQMLSEPAE